MKERRMKSELVAGIGQRMKTPFRASTPRQSPYLDSSFSITQP